MNMSHAARHPSLVTIGSALREARQELEGPSPTPRLDAEVLLMHACGLDRGHLITRAETALTGEQRHRVDNLLARRKRGEPVAYIIGVREFWSMELNVSPAILIPRPETELLVEKALELIPPDAEWTIADLGTGSGAIALALAKERPKCRVIATDVSSTALDVAKSNVEKFDFHNIELRAGDWFAPLARESLDMIVSNPPYVRADDPHLQAGDVRHEPASALISGADGLDAIRHIALHAQEFLKPGGWLLFEHGWDQTVTVGEILRRHGYRDRVCHPDLAGRLRVVASRC